LPQSSEAKKKPKPSSLKLWPEQQAVYEFAVSRDATAMFCEQRTGKTYVTLAILRKLAGAPINLATGEGNDFCGLLVTLLTNRDSTWLDGIRQFLPWLNVTSDWEEFKNLPNPRVLLIHYEMLPKLIKRLVKYKKFNWACVDEAQRIANRGNGASRAMARLSWIERRLVLTGTPQEVRETDYFGIFKFLDPDVFGTNWDKFEKYFMDWPRIDFEHAPPGSALWQKKILQQRILKNKATFREERRQEFIDLLQPYCIRLTKEDVGIKPAQVHKVLVDMTRDQARCYNEMLEQSFTYLPRKKRTAKRRRVLAELVITNIAKRRQIATGFVYDDDERLHDLGDMKLRKTIELVDKLPKPVVVFTAFRPDNDLVYETLVAEGYDVVQVNGSTKKKLRPQIWRDFQKAQYDVAVVQTRTGGTGVDLWKSSHAIVYSMTHSYRDWDQMKSRLDSRSKLKPSEFYVLCSKNTIDEELFDLVIVKKFNTERTLKHLKRGVKKWPAKQKPRRKPKSKPRRRPRMNRSTA
jgi:SNF2 family DNA or RNA helicase